MKDLNNITVFVKAAESKNFTNAARVLGITSSAVSKIISRCEAELGVPLFSRSTRNVQLTPEGAVFLDRCKEMDALLADAEDSLRSNRSLPSGNVRLTMPVGFGRRVVTPALPLFVSRFPDIIMEVELSDRDVDLMYEPVDIAIVRGPVKDARVIAKKLCSLKFVACASPGYLERFGTPQEPEDLAKHECLPYTGPQMVSRAWPFAKNGRPFSMTVSGVLNMNNAESLLEAAISGLGIVMLSDMYTSEAVRQGKLRPLLTDYVGPDVPVSATYLPNRALSRRIRAFVEFLTSLVSPVPPWQLYLPDVTHA